MKKKHIQKLIICGLAALTLSGCTSDSDSLLTGDTYSVTGIASDPYIQNAYFFFDENDDGAYTQGEPLSTPSDENGQFHFTELLSNAHKIIMISDDETKRASHVGSKFYGKFKTSIDTVDAYGNIIASPFTTLQENNVNLTELATLFNEAFDAAFGGTAPHITAADLLTDPMEGLDDIDAVNVNEEHLKKIRASIAAHQYIRVLKQFDRSQSELEYNFNMTELSSNANKEILKAIAKVVKDGCNPTFIQNSAGLINTAITNGLSAVGNVINTSQQNDIKDILALKVSDIAKTCVVIANYASEQMVSEIATNGSITNAFMTSLTNTTSTQFVPDIGPEMYLRRIKNQVENYNGDIIVKTALNAVHTALSLQDSNGNTIDASSDFDYIGISATGNITRSTTPNL